MIYVYVYAPVVERDLGGPQRPGARGHEDVLGAHDEVLAVLAAHEDLVLLFLCVRFFFMSFVCVI